MQICSFNIFRIENVIFLKQFEETRPFLISYCDYLNLFQIYVCPRQETTLRHDKIVCRTSDDLWQFLCANVLKKVGSRYSYDERMGLAILMMKGHVTISM